MINQTKRKTPQKYTKIPVHVGLKSFRKYVAPHLSKGTRGPKPKVSRYRIFNCILEVLRTGMQWDALRVGRNELHPQMYTSGICVGRKMVHTRNSFAHPSFISRKPTNWISQCFTAMVQIPLLKKGRRNWLFWSQASKRSENIAHR